VFWPINAIEARTTFSSSRENSPNTLVHRLF
jgi:hypothetical protein